MPVGANSYGSAADVAALTNSYLNASNAYDTTTIPTLAQVEGWIDQVSGIMNAALAGQGFTVPVTQADAVLAIKSIIVESVADLSHAANLAGRYFTNSAQERGITAMSAIRKQILEWVESFASGLEALGVARAGETGGGDILSRTIDTAGDDITPIFQRKGFGNRFENWDS
jgi:hypothetical protein